MKPESDTIYVDALLPLMEHFYTIQGEGYHSGKAAYFIRLGGCDVGCVWCDVKDSWDAVRFPKVSSEDLLKKVQDSGADRVVITGGEPLMYDLTELTAKLRKAGKKVHLETSGAYPLTGTWDWICVSPKKFKAPLESVLKRADELKVIVFNNSDFEWALSHADHVAVDCKLFLQPEYTSFSKMIAPIVQFAKKHTEWRISLQVHKIMNIP